MSLDYGCGSVANGGAASLIGALTGLRALNLQEDCPEVTDAGAASLQALTGPERLSLRGCCRITGAGIDAAAAADGWCGCGSWSSKRGLVVLAAMPA